MGTAEHESIRLYAKQLHLPSISRYDEILRRMRPEDGYEEFLVQILRRETEERQTRAQERRLKAAGFPLNKTLDEFDTTRLKHVTHATVAELSACDFVKARQNVVMIGNPGTGKTHLAIALGMKACHAGYRVRFCSAAALVTELSESLAAGRLSKLTQALSRLDLLIIDELSYLTFNRAQSELLFQVISERSERSSVIITTNLDFSNWTEIFENQMMLSALIDRVTFHSHILNMNSADGEVSYRLAQSRKGIG